MTIQVLHERGCSNREVARQLEVGEKTVRYRLRGEASGTPDGRADKPFRVEPLAAVIETSLEAARTQGGASRSPTSGWWASPATGKGTDVVSL